MKKIVLIIVVIATTMMIACNNSYKEATHHNLPKSHNKEQWKTINSNCKYFIELLKVEKNIREHKNISAEKIEELMPRNCRDFQIFSLLEQNNFSFTLHTAAQYAIADSLDIMKHFLMFAKWSDSWEYPWEIAIEIEKQHPDKFHNTINDIWSLEEIDNYEIYRQDYLKWESNNKSEQ